MSNGSRSALAPDASLTLVTLGGASLRASEVGDPADSIDAPSTVTLFDLGKPLALITYLACAPERSVAREHFIDLLWGDVEPEAAKHALRQTLWYVRKRLGDRQLISGGDVLTLLGGMDVDRARFLDAVARGDAEAVVQLYTGDFFPGFAAPGGAEFERWVDIERQRLRSLFWRNAEAVVRRWMSSARLRDAQTLARRVRDSDTLREGGWRLLFETLIAAGDTVGGALEADAFDRLVEAEGIEPEPATRSLLRMVRQTPVSATDVEQPGRPSFVAELVGREQEFSQLLAIWDAARGSRAAHVHVLAPAGLGKTRLLTDVHARLRATRARTVFVRASLGARDIPFGLAGDLAEALARLPGASGISTGSARALVSLNPALSASYPAALPDAAGDSADALRRRTVAVRELISAVADEQAVAIFIDDVQWADGRSRQLLASVIGALDSARVMVVTASRPTVDALAAGEQSRTIRLAPLEVSGVSALVSSIAALPSEPWAERLPAELFAATGGSPLLILETLQAVMEGGILERQASGWTSERPARLFAALSAGGALRQRLERLDRVERWVLTLLSVAAVPLTDDVVKAAAGRSHEDLASALGGLERRGLVVRDGDAWMPSHDEIAAVAIELAAPDARSVAARSLGRVTLDRHPGEMRELRHAGALLAEAGDEAPLGVAFSKFARLARQAGDRQPNRALAADFLGERATPALTRSLVRWLPLTHLVGFYSVRRQVFLAAAANIVMFGVLANRYIAGRPQPDVILAIGAVGLDSAARIYRVPIRSGEVGPGSQVLVGGGQPTWRMRLDPILGEPVRRPDNEGWTVERVSSDTGGIDLFDISDDGRETRLTAAHGDDQAASWSPDGRLVAFYTARWNARSHYDLAILDVATRAVRPLTQGPDSDGSPVWSPDGSRIAFTRLYWDGRATQSCVIDTDGGREHCFSVSTGTTSTRAWYDVNHLLLEVDQPPTRFLGRFDLTSGVLDTLVTLGRTDAATLSADGRWVLCRCQRTGYAATAVLLFPTDDPNRVVELDVSPLRNGRRIFAFAPSARRPRHAEQIVIDAGLGAPIVGVSHAFTVTGVSPDGDTVAVGSVRWMSQDTTIASIDSAGVLVPHRAGTVRIEATAGGWRSAGRAVTIRPNVISTLLHETWLAGIEQQWAPFGDPRPRLDTAAAGFVAFLNNGEGSFSSGAYTRARYPTSDGLALDTWISDRVTGEQWQMVNVVLEDALSDVGLRQWNHTSGNLPRTATDPPTCGVAYAGREGNVYGDTLRAVPGRPSAAISVTTPPSFKAGTWFQARVQVFPDGRCGVAVNGVAVAMSQARAIPDRAVRALIFGNSKDTKVLVGPVVARSGVPPDVDWSRVGEPVPNEPPRGLSPISPNP